MEFLLTADLHLSEQKPERLEALNEIVKKAKEKEINYLFIAGDMFDKGVDVENVKTDIRDKFSDNAFKTFVIPGNHDKDAFRKEDYFGDDIEVLKDKPIEKRELNGVNLVAVPYFEGEFEDVMQDILEAYEEDKTNILMLHSTFSAHGQGAFGEEGQYLPISQEQLLQLPFEYAFSGHIHSSPTKKEVGDLTFLYPGSPVSITKSETGRRGVWLYDSKDNNLKKISLNTHHYLLEDFELIPEEETEKLKSLKDRLNRKNLENAHILIRPSGFVKDTESFFEELEEALDDIGADKHDIAKDKIRSAGEILNSALYQSFKERMEEKEDIDKHKVNKIALKALSEVERG